MNTIVIVYYDVQWEHNLFVKNFVSGISSMLFNSKHQHISQHELLYRQAATPNVQ